jgi:hypothetical protein
MMRRSRFVIWGAIWGLILYEVWALRTRDGRDRTITREIVRNVSWWVALPFFGWLWFHLATRYINQEEDYKL